MSGLAAATRRGLSWSSISVAGTALCSVLQLGVAARFLSRDEFGLMALILVVVGFGRTVADLGAANAVLHRQRAPRAELDSLFWLAVGVGVLLFALVSLSGLALAPLWEEPALARWLPVGALIFPFAGGALVPAALLRRELRFRRLAVVALASAAVSLVVVCGLAVNGFGVSSLLAGHVAAAGCRWLGITLASRPLYRPGLHFDLREVRPYVHFGAYQVGERMVNFASWNLDKLVIGAWLGTEALGIYSLAYQLMIRPFRFLASASGSVVGSVLARMQDDRDRLVQGYLTGVRLMALVAFPAYVGAFATADSIVRLVYGPGWEDVATLFAILCPLGALYAIGNPVGGLVVATGKARAAFLWNLFAAGVHVSAVGVGAAFGASGVALALVLATACVLFPGGFYLRWVLVRLRPGAFLACLARPFAYAAVMGAGVHVLAALLPPLPEVLKLVCVVAFGVAVYAVLLWSRERALLVSLRWSRT